MPWEAMPTGRPTVGLRGNQCSPTCGPDRWPSILATNRQSIWVVHNPWALHKTTDGGITWITRTVESESGEITSLVIVPDDRDTLYAGIAWGSGGVYKSTDGGLSWVRAGLEFGVNTDALAIAPTNHEVVYAGNGWGGVFKTNDGGTTWTNISNGLPPDNPVCTLAVDLSDSEIVYAGLNSAGLWKMAPETPRHRVYLPLVLR
jgi:photosystem II stability/assembly factor-like uncharacterized protein